MSPIRRDCLASLVFGVVVAPFFHGGRVVFDLGAVGHAGVVLGGEGGEETGMHLRPDGRVSGDMGKINETTRIAADVLEFGRGSFAKGVLPIVRQGRIFS